MGEKMNETVKEKAKASLEKVKETLKKISKKTYILIGTVLVLMAIAIGAVLLTSNPYSVLFTGLSSSDLSSIVSYLEGQGVTDYKIENSDTILVNKNQEASLKARLLMEGYPQSGFSYSYDTYYNNVGSLSTESERRTTWLHDLQDKMSAVVRCFDNVKNATVDINLGEDSSYVLDQNNKASASAAVLVEMSGTAKLTNDQATAIRRYIANAIQGMTFDAVTIEDTRGNRYTANDTTVDSEASSLKFRLEEEQANLIRSEVMQALVPFYGEDNVRVAVNCTVDVSQRTVSSRDVSLPEWAQDGSSNGAGIKGEQIYEYWVTREEDDSVGGLVGSQTNSDLPEYVENAADPNGSEQQLGGSGTIKYDNPYEETVAIYTAGYLTDCSISVSINAQSGAVDTQEVREHVARAAGIQGKVDQTTGVEYLEDKISVVAQPFYEAPSILPTPSEWEMEDWMLYAIIGGAVLLLLLIVILVIVLRKRSKKRKQKKLDEAHQKELEELMAAAGLATEMAPAAGGADVMTMQTERSMELRKDVRQFSDDNPEVAAQMIRAWLRGGDDND